MRNGFNLRPILVAISASFILFSSLSYADDLNHCVVSTKDSSQELDIMSLEGSSYYSLHFFIEETADQKLMIRPLETQEEEADFRGIIMNVARGSDEAPEPPKGHILATAFGWYANLHLKSVTKEFSRGELVPIVTVEENPYSHKSHIRLILQDTLDHNGYPGGPHAPLAYVRTTWERAQPLTAKVPFINQDATWGKTDITLKCSKRTKNPLGT